jgi:peroxiredoxin
VTAGHAGAGPYHGGVADRGPDGLEPTTGLTVLHLFVRAGLDVDRDAVGRAVDAAQARDAQVLFAAILGHKADACVLALCPDAWVLRELPPSLVRAGLDVADSYVSMTEVSEYASGMPAELLEARLYPKLPPDGLRAFCFYPMSKRRGDVHNWYELDYARREELMRGHGKVGREFKGRVLQVVTGSTGLDDYEWGVTLFGAHLDDLKECVYTMRFDEASAAFGEFGPFYAGIVATIDEVLDRAVP